MALLLLIPRPDTPASIIIPTCLSHSSIPLRPADRVFADHGGTSAYELLTGELVADWLTLLGYPPSERAN